MVERIVPVRVDGVDLLVAAVVLPGSEQTSGVDRVGDRVVQGFDAAQEAIGTIVTRVAGTVRDLAGRGVHPDQVQVEFGLSFTASGNVLVAGSSAEASLKVSVTFDRQDSPQGQTAGQSPVGLLQG